MTIWDASFGELIEHHEMTPEKRRRKLRNVGILLETSVVQLGAEVSASGEQRCDGEGQSGVRQRIGHCGRKQRLDFDDQQRVRWF